MQGWLTIGGWQKIDEYTGAVVEDEDDIVGGGTIDNGENEDDGALEP